MGGFVDPDRNDGRRHDDEVAGVYDGRRHDDEVAGVCTRVNIEVMFRAHVRDTNQQEEDEGEEKLQLHGCPD